MDVLIKELPDFDVAYFRHVGSYFEPQPHWGKLGQWAEENGLFPPNQSFIGISLDNPALVEAESCRHDACVTIPDGFEKEKHTDIQFKKISGGLYAFYQFYDTPDKLGNTYHKVFEEWLPKSEYEADHKYSLEFNLNNPAFDPEGKCKVDLYIPIKKKLSKSEW